MMNYDQMVILVNLAENSRDAISGEGTVTIAIKNIHPMARPTRPPGSSPGDYVCLCSKTLVVAWMMNPPRF